jgi:hypothetical protein
MTFGGPSIKKFLQLHDGKNYHTFTLWQTIYDNVLQKEVKRTRWCIKCNYVEEENIE